MSAAATLTALVSPVQSLRIVLRARKLPTFVRSAEGILTERGGRTLGRYLHKRETHEQQQRRIERFFVTPTYPPKGRSPPSRVSRRPAKIASKLPTLCDGALVDQGDYSRSRCAVAARPTSSVRWAMSSLSEVIATLPSCRASSPQHATRA
jgi:hypothetical protein